VVLQSGEQNLIENDMQQPSLEQWQLSTDLADAEIEDLLEVMVNYAQFAIGSDGIIEARENFFTAMGKTFHNDNFYETRINYFLDYLVFEHHIIDEEKGLRFSSFEKFLELAHAGELNIEEDILNRIFEIKKFRHSVFQVEKVKETRMWLKDLATDDTFELATKGDELFTGFNKKSIIQTFIFPYGEKYWMSRGYIAHPMKATRIIRKYIKNLRKSHNFDPKVLKSRLARQQIRHQRLLHVDPKQIYSTDPR
jgi:hypothetical protein